MTGCGAIYRDLFSCLIISLKLRDISLRYRMWDLSKKDEREDIVIKQLEIFICLEFITSSGPQTGASKKK